MHLVNLKTKYHTEVYIPCIYIGRTVFNFSRNGLRLAPSLIFHILHSLYILEKRIFSSNYGKSILCGFLRPCNSRWTGTNHIYQAGFKLREIHLSLPPVCVWGEGRIKGIHYCTWPSYGLEFFFFPLWCFVSYKSKCTYQLLVKAPPFADVHLCDYLAIWASAFLYNMHCWWTRENIFTTFVPK